MSGSTRSTQTIEERFLPKVDQNGLLLREDLGRCYGWKASLTDKGYPRFRIWAEEEGRWAETTGTQVAWFLATGEFPPKGLWALHRCDNPPCTRFSHLFLGTHHDNMADMAAKGRAGLQRHPELIPRGQEQHSAKLTDEQVTKIRCLYAAGGIRQIDLAEQFGTAQPTISRLLRGSGWRHVETPVPFEALQACAARNERTRDRGQHGYWAQARKATGESA